MGQFGAHCESCMAGGDKTVNHNRVRDDCYAQAKRAQTMPRLEAMGVTRLLGLAGGETGLERPADVLFVVSSFFLSFSGVCALWHIAGLSFYKSHMYIS